MSATTLLTLAAVIAAPAPKKEADAILGAWTVESVVVIGEAIPQPEQQTWIIAADGKIRTVVDKKEQPDKLTYKFDASKNPAYFDMTPGFDGSDKPGEGICKIEGDLLTVCFSLKGKRPTKFVSDGVSPTVIITLKRAKKE